MAIDLLLQAGKPPVLQGDRGLSRKSAEPGNASYYYSLTRMPAAGTVRVGGERFAVTGDAWMDREWSTSSLAADQVGWDWFALQLADGSDLMLYRLRRKDGSADPASSGTVIAPDGTLPAARPRRFPGRRAPATGGARGAAPAILSAGGSACPGRGSTSTSAPCSPTRSSTSPSATGRAPSRSAGTRRGEPVRGRGYVELTGYAGDR